MIWYQPKFLNLNITRRKVLLLNTQPLGYFVTTVVRICLEGLPGGDQKELCAFTDKENYITRK